MLNKFIEAINVTNIDEKTERLFFLEGLTSSLSSWLLVTEVSIVGRTYPPQCGLQDSGDEGPPSRSMSTHTKSHPHWKRLNKITKLTFVAAATVKFTCFSGVDKVLLTWALPGHWSECHLHRREIKATCPRFLSYSVAPPGHVKAGGLMLVSECFAHTVMQRLSFPFACSSQPKQADLTQEAPHQMSWMGPCKEIIDFTGTSDLSPVNGWNCSPCSHRTANASIGSPSSNTVDFVASPSVPVWFPLLTWNSKIVPQISVTEKIKIIKAMPEEKTEEKTIFFKYFPNCHFNNGLTTEYANFPPQIPANANAKQIVINVSM